jgi:GT2 family glycosyltransferase
MELTIAIVSYNARDELENCLRSILENTDGCKLEIIVTDNASTDGSVALLESAFPSVAIERSSENVGFSRASNCSWRRARGELVLFLNSDTIVPRGAIVTMVAHMKARPEIGALGPRLCNAEGALEMSFGTMLSLAAEAWQKLLNAGYRNGAGPLKGFVEARLARERDVDWVSGACLMTRRALLETIGGFDESFFLYSEDVDLCARIRAQGKKIVFTPDVEVTHLRGRSTSKLPNKAFVESQRSRLHFYAKHYGQPRLGLLKLYMTAGLGLAYLFRPSLRDTYGKALRLLVQGDH